MGREKEEDVDGGGCVNVLTCHAEPRMMRNRGSKGGREGGREGGMDSRYLVCRTSF
jgi:hypothetical protein